MKQTYAHKFRRAIQKMALFLNRLGSRYPNHEKISDYERESLAICAKLIHDEENVLLLSPISGKRYIKSDKAQVFVIIENGLITIVNHQYSYNIDLWGKAMERIIRLFDVEVEKRRTQMENEIRSNVKHSLSNIYKSLVHEKV